MPHSKNYKAMMGFGYGMVPWGWGGGVVMVLWWAFVIVGVITLIKWLSRGGEGLHAGRSAIDILKERYARGEMDQKEFEEKKRDLT